jgi:hypothetical protein
MSEGWNRKIKEITEILLLAYLYLREHFMETYKLCVFVFWIDALKCVYMKPCRSSWLRKQNIIHILGGIFSETVR